MELAHPAILFVKFARVSEVNMNDLSDLDLSKEIWETLIYQGNEFPDFEVSNFGQLRNSITKKIYKQWINHKGYCQVCVSLGSRSKKKTFKMHKAVAETFIPNPENKPEVNHIDGNKANAKFDNLEWTTSSENTRHAYDTGLIISQKGEQRPGAKLTKEQVEYIRNNYIPKDKEFGCRALARKFNIHHKAISSIINNKAYIYD